VVTTMMLANAVVGQAYSANLQGSGGSIPYTWTLGTGSLPAGLTLGTNGAISGTPTTAGPSTFTVKLTDANMQVATGQLTLTVFPALVLGTMMLNEGYVTNAYAQTLMASGGQPPYMWSLAGGSLPAGITLTSGGILAGTPTTAGSYGIALQVADASGQTQQGALTLNIYDLPTVSTVSLANGAVNAPYTQTLSAAGGKAPYTFTLAAGTLPAGLTLAAGAIAGVPTATAVAPITVQVADANGKTGQKNFTLSVFNGLVITSQNPPDSDVGATYSQTLAAVGGQQPYTWSLSGGSLPAGITLSAGGTLSGSPTMAGTFTFTVTATDAANMTFAKQFTVQIFAAPSITTTSLPDVYSGSAYTAMLAGTGGKTPYSFSISSGTLPAGVSLSSAGVLSGTTTITGAFPLTVTLTDANNVTASKPLTLTVVPALAVTTTSLSDAYVGTPYSGTFAATGGVSPYTFAISAGMLPSGIMLNASSGALSGTPTAASAPTFTVQVTDSAGKTATAQLTLAALAPPSISTVSLADAYVGSGYSGSIAGAGGRTPYTFAITTGALPNGLSLSAGGAITGTPTAIGGSSFTVTITDANGVTGTKMMMLAVDAPLVLTTTFADAYVGTAYSQMLTATGGKTPYTWSLSAGALPAGLTLMAASSVVSGTPSSAGTTSFTLTATDANGSSSSTPLTMTVFAAPMITTTTLPDGYPSLPYSAMIASSGGKAPYTFSISAGALPTGVGLNAGSGALSGAPSGAPGTASFTVQLKDANNITTTAPLSIVVRTSLSVTTTTLPDGYVTAGYNQMLAATGGKPGYTWSVGSGTLPAGLTLSAAGALSGTPTAANTYSFTAVATDANGVQASQPLTVQTYALPTVTTTSPLPSAYNGTLYNQTLTVAGGKPGYMWSLASGTPPAGITLSAAGVLNGTPSTAGTSMFTVQVQDSNGKTGQAMLSLTVLNGFNITTASVADGYTSNAYSVMLNAAGGQAPYSNWQVISGALPTGLTLATATGVISGTPTVTGPAMFTVQVQDNLGAIATKPFTLTVYTPPSITTTALNDGYIGVAYNQMLVGTNGKAPYSWAVTIGTLPAGVTLTANTGVLAGSPTGPAGASNITVTLTDANGKTATQALTLNVYAKPTVNPATPPDGYLTVAYNLALSETGGKAPFAWSAVGTPPAGLSINPGTGAITGTPTMTGTASFSAQVTDANNQSGTLPLSITTYALPSITTTTLPGAFLNVAYSAPVMETGGKAALAWSVSVGALPPGVSISPTTGQLSGTPTASGTFNFTVQVLDANNKAATQALSIVVAAPLVITRTSLNDAYRTVAYSDMMTATGGKTPYTYTITNGTLPSGIVMSGAGVFSGTPGVAAMTQTIIVQVTDANNTTATQSLTLNVYDLPAVTTVSLPDGYNTAAYPGATLAASGGKAPLTWSIASGSLPMTLSLTPASGAISGTVVAGASTQTVTFKVADANGQSATRMLTINIYALPSLSVAAPNDGYVGGAYSWTFNAAGGKPALTWSNSAGTLPTGLTLNPANGQLSGTFGASITNGTVFNFTITVSDANSKFDSKPFSITVYQPPSISPTSPVVGTEGVTYMHAPGVPEAISASGGKAPLTYSATNLPPGLTLNTSNGVISGIPNQNDSATSPYAVTFRVTDANGVMGNAAPAMTINAAKPIYGGGTLSIAPQGSAITDQVTVFVYDGETTPRPGVGCRLRKNGVEYSPIKQALTDVNGKVWFSGLGLNGTTDTIDITCNGTQIANTAMLQVNAAIVSLTTFDYPVPSPRTLFAYAWNTATSKLQVFGGSGYGSANLGAADDFAFTTLYNDVLQLDTPSSGAWSEAFPPGMITGPSPRSGAVGASGGGSVSYLFGGQGDTGGNLGDLWAYDSSATIGTRWTFQPSGPPGRTDAVMTADGANGLYLFGGSENGTAAQDLWEFNPVSKMWSPMASAPAGSGRYLAAGAYLFGSQQLLVCGGFNGPTTFNNCLLYSRSTNTWATSPATLPTPRAGLAMANSPGGNNAYMFGGCGGGSCFNDVAVYNAGTWSVITPSGTTVPDPRQDAALAVDTSGNLIMFGGQDSAGNPDNDTWTFNVTTHVWTQTGPAPITGGPTTFTVSGNITNGSQVAAPAANRVRIQAAGASGWTGVTIVNLAAGAASYTLYGVPAGDTITVRAFNFSAQAGVQTSQNYLDLGVLAPIAGNTVQNIAFPLPAPAPVTASSTLVLPSSWPPGGLFETGAVRPYRAGYSSAGSRNGVPTVTPTLSFSWYPETAPAVTDAWVLGQSPSPRSCELAYDFAFNLTPPTVATMTLPAGPRSEVPGINECIPSGNGFSNSTSVVLPNGPGPMASGDFNGDGLIDFAVADTIGGQVQIMLADGVGGFQNPIQVGGLATPQDVKTIDINAGDGKLDLVIVDQGTLIVRLGDGTGNFPTVFASQPLPGGGRAVAVADFNNDTFTDYAVAEPSGAGNLQVFAGSGGTLSLYYQNPAACGGLGNGIHDVAAADLNSDGRPDLIVACNTGIAVLMNSGANFAAPVNYLGPLGSGPVRVIAARMHVGSGPKDVLGDFTNGTTSNLVIYNTSATGTLTLGTQLPVSGSPPGQLAAADLNGDGNLDALVATNVAGLGAIQLAFGDGAGGLGAIQTYPMSAPQGLGVAAGDINGDGKMDFAGTTSAASGGISGFVQLSPYPTVAEGTYTFTSVANSQYVTWYRGAFGLTVDEAVLMPQSSTAMSVTFPARSTLAPERLAPSGQLVSWQACTVSQTTFGFNYNNNIGALQRIDNQTCSGGYVFQRQ
jgi:hypothetical protein